MPSTRTTPKEDRELAQLQAAATEQDTQLPAEERATDVPEDTKTERKPGVYAKLAGKEFRLADDVGVMALMEWVAAGDGEEEGTAIGSNLRAMFHLLEDIIDPEDFPRFRSHARVKKCGYKEFIDFQNKAFEALSANPTEQPGS